MRPKVGVWFTLAALAGLAAWPIWQAGPPTNLDAPNHFYRLVELQALVRQGQLYPRWFPDVQTGFGAPLLNFYAPLAYYVWLALADVVGALPTAFLLGFVVALVVALLGMYAWLTTLTGAPLAGLTAAAAYALAPYLYFNALGRGAYPELLALAWAPWLLWAAVRCLRQPTAARYCLLASVYAVVILTHPLTALALTPVVVGHGLTVSVAEDAPRPALGRWGVSLAALLHGAALAAFFIWPFVREADSVRLAQATARYDYHDYFLTWAGLWQSPTPFDARQVRNTNLDAAGLAWPVAAVVLASLPAAARTWARRWVLAGLAAPLVGAAVLTLSIAAPVWAVAPGLALLQFPWRLLGPATLLLAALAGWGVAALPARSQTWATLLAVTASFGFSLSWTYAAPFSPYPADPTPADVVRYEQANPASRGLTGSQEFLPRGVAREPDPQTLSSRYAADPTPARLGPLPAGVTVLEAVSGALAHTLRYSAPTPFTVSWYQFYAPGWSATLDGVPVAVAALGPEALASVAAPAGTHTVRLAWTATSAVRQGSVVSLAAVGAGLALLALRRTPRATPQPAAKPKLSVAWAALPLLLLAVRLVTDGTGMEMPWTYSRLNHRQTVVQAQFAELSLVGVDYPAGARARPGEAWPVEVYWQATAPPQQAYKTVLVLWSADGQPVAQHDNYLPAGYPTLWWRPGQYGRDGHTLLLPENLPAGDYVLTAGLYYFENDDPAQLVTVDYQIEQGGTGASYPVGSVTVSPNLP